MLTEEKIRTYYRKKLRIGLGNVTEGNLNSFYKSAKAYAVYFCETQNRNSNGINDSVYKYSEKLIKCKVAAVDSYVSDISFF